MKIPIWNVLWNTIPLFKMPEYILYICIFGKLSTSPPTGDTCMQRAILYKN